MCSNIAWQSVKDCERCTKGIFFVCIHCIARHLVFIISIIMGCKDWVTLLQCLFAFIPQPKPLVFILWCIHFFHLSIFPLVYKLRSLIEFETKSSLKCRLLKSLCKLRLVCISPRLQNKGTANTCNLSSNTSLIFRF